jgi:hypothetical protein
MADSTSDAANTSTHVASTPAATVQLDSTPTNIQPSVKITPEQRDWLISSFYQEFLAIKKNRGY